MQSLVHLVVWGVCGSEIGDDETLMTMLFLSLISRRGDF